MVCDNTGSVSVHPASPPTSTTSNSRLMEDGFTSQEVREAVKTEQATTWHPTGEYIDVDIGELTPGPRRVCFMGRVANIYDIMHTPKSEEAAKGGVKICVKDDTAAITVRVWYAKVPVQVRLGSLVSVWATHVSNGGSSSLSSRAAPYFVSIFPERDHSCYFMVHKNSDDGLILRSPLGICGSQSAMDLMTLQNFIDGGHDAYDARILVIVKAVGARKIVSRQDGSTISSVMVSVHDDTANATLGLYGTSSLSPFALTERSENADELSDDNIGDNPWRSDKTVLLLQSPGWSLGRHLFLKLQSATILDVDPEITDAHWLRKWAARKKSRETVNPPFPHDIFSLSALENSAIRALFTIAELDEFARAAPNETFQGYLSVLLTELRLVDEFRRSSLMSGECCNTQVYANATQSLCKGCDKIIYLRLNPRIIGRLVDETAQISTGKLLLSDQAWIDLLGHTPAHLLNLRMEDVIHLSDRLLFSRVTLLFGWCGDAQNLGGRICVLGVRS